MSKSIYSIEQEYYNLMLAIEENDGELTEELEEQLAINEEQLEYKVKNYVNFIKLLEGEIQANKDIIERHRNLIANKTNLIIRLKDNLKTALELYGEEGRSGNKVLNYDTVKLYTRKNEVVKIDDESKFILENFTGVDGIIKTKFNKLELVNIINHIKGIKGTGFEVDFDYKIDKKTVKQELKAGVELKHCNLVREDSIVIK